MRSLLLEPWDGVTVPPHRPGQFVTLRLTDDQGTPLTRSYSISAHGNQRTMRISVKRAGRASAIVHERLTLGDEVEVGASRGSLVLETNSNGAMALISAGIGVTPVLAMLGALAEQRSTRPVAWVHVARCGAAHAFAHEARQNVAMLPRATSHVLYTKPRLEDRAGQHYDAQGRLRREHLAALPLPPDAHAYVCGPAGFMANVTDMLRGIGLDPAHIHTETFGSVTAGDSRPPHAPTPPSRRGAEVFFARSGISARFDRERWASPLELAEDCDVPVSWSCRTGVCHRCESAIVAGEVHYDPQPLDPPAPGNTLLCCARPTSDVTLDL